MASAIVSVASSDVKDGTCPALILAIASWTDLVVSCHARARSFEPGELKKRKNNTHNIIDKELIHFL